MHIKKERQYSDLAEGRGKGEVRCCLCDTQVRKQGRATAGPVPQRADREGQRYRWLYPSVTRLLSVLQQEH